jgi:hypothetical protein
MVRIKNKNMDKEKQQIIDAYNKLPNDIQEAIKSVGFGHSVQEIGKKYKLHIDQLGELEDETTLVMLGVVHPMDFLSDIKFRLEIDDKKTNDIVHDINEQIFKPIKNSLMGIHKINENYSQNNNIEGKIAEQIDDEILNKEDILKEVESEPKVKNDLDKQNDIKKTESEPTVGLPNQPGQKNIVEDKLNQPFKIPIEKTEHKAVETPSATNAGYKDIHPYREPAE